MEPTRPPDALRCNVELKARLESLEPARAVARRLATRCLGAQRQLDTYFACPNGRLKLRELDHQTAQLIWYERPDVPEAKTSRYYLIDVPDPVSMKQLLLAALGLECVIEKHREIYLHDNVRIHLDQVKHLGCFLEFEAVLQPREPLVQGEAQVERLRREFGISAGDLLAGSYREMRLSARPEED